MCFQQLSLLGIWKYEIYMIAISPSLSRSPGSVYFVVVWAMLLRLSV